VATTVLEFVLPLIGNEAWLLVLKTNLPAINLYQTFGFKVVEEFIGKYNRKIEVVVLRLAIEPALKSWKVDYQALYPTPASTTISPSLARARPQWD
jgi:ribosomal protein S18 acetylase RimI-like enzyme